MDGVKLTVSGEVVPPPTPLRPGRQRVIRVNEIFGPVFQGEGPDVGRAMLFVRLAGCNLDCAWCDTPYSWDWERFDPEEESHTMTLHALVDEIVARSDTAAVCFTGGEPLVQQKALTYVAGELPGTFYVTVETNGTRAVNDDLWAYGDRFVVSPKLANSGIPADKRLRRDVLEAWGDRWRSAPEKVAVKAVVAEWSDLGEVDALADVMGIDRSAVWVMPEGTNRDDLLYRASRLEPYVLAHGYRLSMRTQVLLHGDARGV